jgi:ABC-2 type transport system permease protein
VTSIATDAPGRLGVLRGELRKIPAFARRDLLVAWSYRMSFFSDIIGLVGQVLVFAFVGQMIDSDSLPRYGGTQVSYLEFAAVGIAISVFLQLGLDRVSVAIRGEQLMGTLEPVLATPTSTSTVQLGAVAFDLIYVPLRTAVFLTAVTLAFGLDLDASGLLPAMAILLVFIPLVWGLGVASAAAVMTFRRGSGLIGTGVIGLGLISGIFFPITLLPDWAQSLAAINPVATAIDGMREALLGGEGWAAAGSAIAHVAPWSIAVLGLGLFAFRVAVRRERRRGTLGLY